MGNNRTLEFFRRAKIIGRYSGKWLLGQAAGPIISDAHLAALTIEYGGVVHTTDRDFARFPDLRWANPLA